MEKRIASLETNFSEMQKSLYQIEATLEVIVKQITGAISLNEDVIILTEKYKSIDKRVMKCEWKREAMEKDINAINMKLAWYWVWITLLAIIIPYFIKIITW